MATHAKPSFAKFLEVRFILQACVGIAIKGAVQQYSFGMFFALQELTGSSGI